MNEMKKSILVCTAIGILTGCASSSNESGDSSTEQKPSILSFLDQSSALETDTTSNNPIVAFSEAASNYAVKSAQLTTSNIASLLEEVASHKQAVIVVEDHTIIKIASTEDCKPSGSWGACMPLSEGYVKRGSLVEKNDYANNIIGLPDDQERTIYFFD